MDILWTILNVLSFLTHHPEQVYGFGALLKNKAFLQSNRKINHFVFFGFVVFVVFVVVGGGGGGYLNVSRCETQNKERRYYYSNGDGKITQ